MDETTPVVKPTFLEKMKLNKKELLTRLAIVGGVGLGIFAAVVVLKKEADEEPEVDYIVIEEIPVVLTTESTTAA